MVSDQNKRLDRASGDEELDHIELSDTPCRVYGLYRGRRENDIPSVL